MMKLTCKKDLIGNRTFRKNKEYEISNSEFSEYYKNNSCFMLTDEYTNDLTELKGLWFGKPFSHNLYDYFYTEQELRKIKLQKLNDIPNL